MSKPIETKQIEELIVYYRAFLVVCNLYSRSTETVLTEMTINALIELQNIRLEKENKS
jgi:hypothetical protein